MVSRKVLFAALVGAALIVGLTISAFTQTGPVYMGGPQNDGKAQLFLALEPADPVNPVPLPSFTIKPNKTFKVRLFLDTRNLIYSNQTTAISNEAVRVAEA